METTHPVTEAVRASSLTVREVALVLGLSRPAVYDRLRGRTDWTLREAALVAKVLGVSLDELVGDVDLPLGYTVNLEGSPA